MTSASHRFGPHRTVGAPSAASAAALLVMTVLGLIVLSLTVLGTALVRPASAHTDLLQGSPGPAQSVGGTVDFIDLAFVDRVSDATITLEDPNGDLVPGFTSVTEGQILRYEMTPLTLQGRYIVRFNMISADGDDTDSGFFFTYDSSAVEPVRIGEVDLPDDGNTVVMVIASVVFALCLIGLVMIFLTKLERGRADKVPVEQ